MLNPEEYIKHGLGIVKTLISQDKLEDAYKACRELAKVNPYHRKVQSLMQEIEEHIISKNEHHVDHDIEKTMHLWQEQRYDELMNIYAKLYQYAPQHKKLRSLIEKLNAALSKEQKQQRGQFVSEALAAVNDLMKEKRYGDSVQACNELLQVDPANSGASSLLQKAKTELIEEKLRQNERVVEGADFERSLDFLETLRAIDPANKKVQTLENRIKAHLAEQKALSAKVHLHESIARMKELFKNAEYEKVEQACREVQQLDPGNFTARIFIKKARSTLLREIDQNIIKKLKEAFATSTLEYQKNPGVFVLL